MKRSALFILSLAATFATSARAHEEVAANEMAVAANQLIATFTPEQKAAGLYTMKDDHRLDWHFIPKNRKGAVMKEMTPQQQHLTTALLASSLSSSGLRKAANIMSLEQVLQTIEGPNRRFPRDPQEYHVSIFGQPGPGKTWGWRFEGHHLSLSFTIVEGRHISSTPTFMGTNPGIIKEGPHKGLQVLADEENIGRALAQSLSKEQRAVAVFDVKAPSDVLSGSKRKVSPLKPDGIGWQALNAQQQAQVWSLVEIYVRRARGEIADADLKKIADAGRDHLFFAWAGGMEPGQGSYYRIQGPTFLIEYDNTQNNANHVHAVYRDFSDDFGEDLLMNHYEQSHHD